MGRRRRCLPSPLNNLSKPPGRDLEFFGLKHRETEMRAATNLMRAAIATTAIIGLAPPAPRVMTRAQMDRMNPIVPPPRPNSRKSPSDLAALSAAEAKRARKRERNLRIQAAGGFR
jgi:hypothetical protein